MTYSPRRPSALRKAAWLGSLAALSMILPAATAGAAFGATVIPGADPTGAPGSFSEQNLAADRTENNWFYRIPALAHLGDGVVLASWDARPGSAADAPNPNTIVQRRSTDNGATWGPLTTIAAGHIADDGGPKYGYSDPSYVLDAEAGKVFAFFVHSKDQGFHGSAFGNDDADRQVIGAAVVESADAGLTWSEPRLITDVVKPGADRTPEAGDVRSMFATSGEGIQLTRGEYKGRLVQQYAGDVQQADGSRSIQAYSVYSDDHGATWQRGEFVGTSMDENKVVELSDGRVMLNSRDSSNGGYRKAAISTNGGESYSEAKRDTNLPDPTNNAHITQLHPGAAAGSRDARKLLYTGANSQTGRENVSARVSCDDGASWPGLRTIRHGFSAYSSSTALADGRFGVLYEGNYTDSMPFASFDEEWLNYVCAPQAAEDFSADAGATHTLPVTITNQEDTALSGSLQLAASNLFDSNTVEVADLPAGESRTVELEVKVPATANGKYLLQTAFTAADGTEAQGNVRATIAGKEVTGIEIDGFRADSDRDLAANPYAAGDAVPYSFKVTSASNIGQWVVPTEGNFTPFAAKPVGETSPAGNCRYGSLAAGASYTCTTPRHMVSAAELADGFFTPLTKWTTGRIGANYDVVDSYEITGDEVDLLARAPKLEAAAGAAELQDRDANGHASVGDTVTHVITLKNTGNVRLTALAGEDSVAGELAAGASVQATATHTVTAEDLAAGKLAERTLAFTAANGATALEAAATLGGIELVQAPGGNATSAPAKATLSHDNGRTSGLADGDYRVTMELPWGTNATSFTLYENDVAISTQQLTANTPESQQAVVAVTGKPNGTYRYRGELANAAGTTTTATLVVKVRDASPAAPAISLEGEKFAGSYTVHTNLWQGTNATGYTLYENGIAVDRQDLAAATPAAQKASTSFTDKAPGTYRYVAELANAAGSTRSKTLVVNVK
ncbi:exo-alpha-sialidase [Paeniglutamicibacter psychrophenolicus]|uniref:exo-alpha-sialidase n=1 Tax=Paeniglutamicibacter psychrophenolicus TaxID=257454 RepID=UPI002787056D|nr:exo-alpha-sialidase [Paeniglutamicibacter psychrophenolicus]MDQ0093833.1 sialidase-1 [Paeniglutamicibacter psychrophenolicus]